MRKYTQVMKLNFQVTLAYKWNLMITAFMDIFRIVAEIAFWKILFDATAGKAISGYDFKAVITYYVFMFLIGAVMNVGNIGYKVATDIKEGSLNNLLTKPINYIGYYFSETISHKFVQLFVVIVMFIPVFLVQASNISIGISIEQLVLFPLVLVFSLLLNFFINIMISLFVFWLTEVTSFFFLKDILLDFLSGRVFPIDLLPKSILNIFGFLPFMYCTFFPITILTKGMVNEEFFKGVFIQVAWLLILYLLIKLLWKLGIKKYAGTGA